MLAAQEFDEPKLRDMKEGHWLREFGGYDFDLQIGKNSTALWRDSYKEILFRPPSGNLHPRVSIIPEQRFEGEVIAVYPGDHTFYARLKDKTKTLPDEDAEFPYSEISEDDLNLIVPGALFSWNIFRENRKGQVRRVSEIRFLRGIAFSKESIDSAIKMADILSRELAAIGDEPQ